jgi:hypothetical protein
LRRTFIRRSYESVLQHTRLEPAPNQSQETLIVHAPCDLPHQSVVVNSVKGSRYTLPIISTFPRESQLSALAIRLKACLSTFFGRHTGKGDCN